MVGNKRDFQIFVDILYFTIVMTFFIVFQSIDITIQTQTIMTTN